MAVAEQRMKQQGPNAKTALARRAVIVEPTFAFAKHGLGFRRWSLRTFGGIRTQWALMCTTVNLRKLYVAWVNGTVQFG